MPSRGIVLDFDGVLARSMELHAEAYRRVLAPYGLRPSDRDIFLQEGARSETILRDALATVGAADEDLVGRLADEKQQVFRSLGPPSLYPDAERLVQRLADAGAPLGLVTGTRRANLERLIPDLLPRFTAVLAQDAYTHDKPHPEPYARAAVALGVPPGGCAVLENAVRGVASAKAAGCGYVVGITTTLGAHELAAAGADRTVAGHGEAVDALLAWLDAT